MPPLSASQHFWDRLLTFPIGDGQIINFDEISYDVVVLTQSCDLDNAKVSEVILCAHWDVDGVKCHDPSLVKGGALGEVRSGRRPRYTLLNRSGLLDPPLDLRIVDCGKVFCLPFAFVQALAVHQGPRLRLRSPYREHLSQAFARFFMRVGLPQDVQL